jgi:hypothetical protein
MSAATMTRLVALAVDRYGGVERSGTVVETDEATSSQVADVTLNGM